MIQNKMHQFIKGCSKFKPKNKILYISIIYASILFTGCQTVQTIVSHPDYDMFDLLRGHNTYNQTQQFPSKGYKIRGIRYHDVVVKKFPDNDSLFYLKYNPKYEERNFYFSVIDKYTVDTLLSYALDKKKVSGVYRREEYVDKALVQLGIKNYQSNEGLWTYFAPKYKMVKGNLPTDIVKSGFHREYEVFNYKAAQKAYYLQRHPEQKRSAFEILGALYIINHLSKYGKKDNGIYYNGVHFRNQADVEDYKNANGLK